MAWTVLVLTVAGLAAAQQRDRDRRRPGQRSVQQYETALGIQVREGRRPRAGVEVTVRPEGSTDAPPLTATTDSEGRAAVWGLAPGVWRLELSTRDEPDFVLSVRVLPERRAEQVGAAARDVDAPDLRWRFFRVTEPPPAPVVRRPEPEPTAPPRQEPVREEPPTEEPARTEPARPQAAPPAVPAQPPTTPSPIPAAPPPATAPEVEERPAPPSPPTPAEEREPREAQPAPSMPPAEPPPPVEEADEPVPTQQAVPGLVKESGDESERKARPAEPAYEPPPMAAEPAQEADEPVPQVPVPEETLVRTETAPSEAPSEAPPSEAPPAEVPPTQAPDTAAPPAGQEPPVRAPELPEPPVLEREIPPAAPQPPTGEQEPPAAIERPEPPQAPMPPQPPELRVRSAEAGDCDACREGEVMVTVARTVAPGGAAGGAECTPGTAAAALAAARRQAGASSPQALEGGEVAPYTAASATCQVFGVVLPPGTRYRGFEYRANGQWCAPEGECARVPGVLWPARPVIRDLEGGGTLVYGVMRNTSEVPQRGELAVFYVGAP